MNPMHDDSTQGTSAASAGTGGLPGRSTPDNVAEGRPLLRTSPGPGGTDDEGRPLLRMSSEAPGPDAAEESAGPRIQPAAQSPGVPDCRPAAAGRPPYTTLGGWLTFFLVLQAAAWTFIGPKSLADTIGMAGAAPAFAPSLYLLAAMDACVFTALIAANIMVLCKKKNAVRFIKRMYVVSLLYSLLAPALATAVINVMNGLDLPVATACTASSLRDMLHSVIFFCIWFTYFSRARRIRDIWGADA